MTLPREKAQSRGVRGSKCSTLESGQSKATSTLQEGGGVSWGPWLRGEGRQAHTFASEGFRGDAAERKLWKIDRERWFSNLRLHQEVLLKHSSLGPTPRVSNSLGLG